MCFILDAKLKLLDEDNILQDVRNDIDQLVRGNHGNKDKNPYGNRKGLGELKRELRERGQVCNRNVTLLCGFSLNRYIDLL